MIGLFFAWLLRQTGSLWVPISCHAAYNALLFLALRYLPG
jgi:membrane protease YdiL (CAAX protease family)